ncbi:MAG: hypothetical protein IJ009_00175 [Clostridia bacterium]|nr:hypothetical protein [Clostridia bacterium]
MQSAKIEDFCDRVDFACREVLTCGLTVSLANVPAGAPAFAMVDPHTVHPELIAYHPSEEPTSLTALAPPYNTRAGGLLLRP